MKLSSIPKLLEEARRRRVYISVVAYIAIGVGIIEMAEPITEALLLPDATPRVVTVLVILGFPVVLVLAWIFDITTKGVKRTPPADAAVKKRSAPTPAIASGAPIPSFPDRPRKPAPRHVQDGPERPPDPLRVRRVALGHLRHELRTPINGILGYSDMVREEVDDPAILEDLGRIQDAGTRLLALVDEILSPDATGPAEKVGLDALGARVRADLRTPVNAVIGYTEIVMEAAAEAGRDDLQPDLKRIREAAARLLEMSEDIVTVAASRPGADDDLDGSLGRSSELAREVLAKIRPSEGRKEPRAPGGEGRILVVDDNPMNRDLLVRGLARAGYMVAEAEDGRSALALLEDQSFDVILLDVIMPVLDGVETLLRIRSDDRLGDTPVIMLSSLDEVDSVIRCIELGAEEYLVKPVPPSLLEARVAANLELRTMRSLGREYHQRLLADEEFIQSLLARTLPARFRDRVRSGNPEGEERYSEATALCCVFAQASDASVGPRSVYSAVEDLAESLGIEMAVWRPDSFVALAAADGRDGEHATTIAELALRLPATIATASADDLPFRIGIHTGPAWSGIVGRNRFRFDLWGEAVELAEGVALRGPASAIVVTPAAHAALRHVYDLEPRGIVDVGGRGQMRMYLLAGRLEKVDAQG